jgi:hypothetical protein
LPFIDIEEERWPVYEENQPKTDTTQHFTPAPGPRTTRANGLATLVAKADTQKHLKTQQGGGKTRSRRSDSTPTPGAAHHLAEDEKLVDANNQLAPQIPLADGASKARTKEAKRHKKVSPSPDPAWDQGFPRRTRAEAQEHHHDDASKKDTTPKRRRRRRFRPQPEQDFRPAESRNLTPAARGPARPPSPSRTQTATNRS